MVAVWALQIAQFDTNRSDWREFAYALAEYGYSVFKGWFISGSIYRMAANHGRGRGVFGLDKIPEDLQLSNDENGGAAHELAAELVLVAIDAFRRKTLMNPDPTKRWTAAGGASIKTFFIGRCLMELPDIYERMARKDNRFRNEGARFATMS